MVVSKTAPQLPEAILFDVQGTATDFHSTICRAAAAVAAGRYPNVDWSEFVNNWRRAYSSRVTIPRAENHGNDAWTPVTNVYREALDSLLKESGINLSGAERDELNSAWHHLDPWPDSKPGLDRLRKQYILATLSNADVSAVIRITQHCDFPWHAVFTAEMVGTFKPDPAVYRYALRSLGLPPDRVMMVASHKYDLRAAADIGLLTGFVARPYEYGEESLADADFSDEFDFNARDFLDLADQLGC